MKKIFTLLLFVLSMVVVQKICYALGAEEVISGTYSAAKNVGMYTYNASSATATKVSTQLSGKGIMIFNTNSFSVQIATYAVTAGNGIVELGANDKFIDDLQPYSSYWYILGGAGQSTSTIDTIEKWGY